MASIEQIKEHVKTKVELILLRINGRTSGLGQHDLFGNQFIEEIITLIDQTFDLLAQPPKNDPPPPIRRG